MHLDNVLADATCFQVTSDSSNDMVKANANKREVKAMCEVNLTLNEKVSAMLKSGRNLAKLRKETNLLNDKYATLKARQQKTVKQVNSHFL